MMSLKSGLLADSSWAMDTLTILLHDETTYGYFNLRHHHNLLNTLVDHFKVMLGAIFGIDFEDMETYYSGHSGSKVDNVLTTSDRNTAGLDVGWSDYDVLLGGDETMKEDKENLGVSTKAEMKMEVDCEDGCVPVANTYDVEQLNLGKSDDLSHIAILGVEDCLFPSQEVMLSLLPESKRIDLEKKQLLQRVDQTPVSVLLKRETLLDQIPLHRLSRHGYSPRRRDRSFFVSARSKEGMSSGGGGGGYEGVVSSTGVGKGTTIKTDVADESCGNLEGATCSVNCGKGHSSRENQCKSPRASVSQPSTNLSPPENETCSSPLMVEENEVYRKEDLPLWSIPPSKEELWRRCECLSNILRSLTFVAGNDVEFCQHPGMLIILGKLLMLHHYHVIHSSEKRQLATDASLMTSPSDALESEGGSGMAEEEDGASLFAPKVDEGQHRQQPQFPPAQDHWWWDCLNTLREDTLVILANISGQLDLSIYPETISFPIIDGLLHWLVCPSSVATDPLPDSSKVYSQSPQRLVVETFAKMTISELNVDLILATPPLMRLDVVFSRLGQMVGQKKHPVVRQFALVLLSNLAQGHECCCRLIAQQKMVISLLLECVEISEHMACMGGSIESGFGKDDPSSLSVAMLRRAATTLHCISRVPANRTAFLPYRDRILYLTTSQFVEPSVSSILMDMLYEFGKL